MTGHPGPANSTPVRKLEHDVAGLTADNPYSGNTHELITNYLADPAEEAILHMVNADPAERPRSRCSPNPTFTSPVRPRATNHRAAAGPARPELTVTPGTTETTRPRSIRTVGLVGPGRGPAGPRRLTAELGPNSAGPNSGQVTVPRQRDDGHRGPTRRTSAPRSCTWLA